MFISEVCPLNRVQLPCQPLEADQRVITFTLPAFPDWQGAFYRGAEAIGQAWPVHDREGQRWLEKDYMELLAEIPQGVENHGLVLTHESGEKIYLTLQLLTFQPGKQIRRDAASPERESGNFRRRLAQWLSFRVLTIGQFMVSGPFGWQRVGNNFVTNEKEVAELVVAAASEVKQIIGNYSALLIKDLVDLKSPLAAIWEKEGFYQLPVDPSMSLDLRSDWTSFDDYLLDMSSKYRVRCRRARKQLPAALERKSLSLSECKTHAAKMYELYLEVKAEAAFDAVNLSPGYFVNLKKKLGDQLQVTAYFLAGKMIGFRTTLDNGSVLHAHYLGFEQQLNRDYHLYHNMLLDLVADAIEDNYEKLDLGRTALEIKSSIGAAPTSYCCAIKATNPFYNALIPIFTPALFQPARWTQRNPFK